MEENLIIEKKQKKIENYKKQLERERIEKKGEIYWKNFYDEIDKKGVIYWNDVYLCYDYMKYK